MQIVYLAAEALKPGQGFAAEVIALIGKGDAVHKGQPFKPVYTGAIRHLQGFGDISGGGDRAYDTSLHAYVSVAAVLLIC